MTQEEFEAPISGPPFNYPSFPKWDEPGGMYHGKYKNYAVQLAWEVLQEVERRKGKEEEK